MKQVYILQLANAKWYVGVSENVKRRIQSHMSGEGCEWTRIHKPIKCILHKKGSEFDEEVTTLEYMAKYGIDNVRGGSYANNKLSESQRIVAAQQVHSIKGECYKCGNKSHKASDCLVDKLNDYCHLCYDYDESINEIFPTYGKGGIYYAGDGCYIPCPGCQPGYD